MHAGANVVVEEHEPQGIAGCRHRLELRQHVDAVGVVLDHLGDAAELPLHPSHPGQRALPCVNSHPSPPVADQLAIPWGGMVHRTGGPWPSSPKLAATSVTSDTIRRGGCRSDRPTEGARGGHNERGRAAGWSAHLLRAFEEGT